MHIIDYFSIAVHISYFSTITRSCMLSLIIHNSTYIILLYYIISLNDIYYKSIYIEKYPPSFFTSHSKISLLTRTCSHPDIEYPKKICEYQMKYYPETQTKAKWNKIISICSQKKNCELSLNFVSMHQKFSNFMLVECNFSSKLVF